MRRLSCRFAARTLLASLAASFAVLAGCACCGPSEGADEGSPLLADATGPAAAAPSSASAGIATGQVKLGDLSTDPALRDALMQVAALLEGVLQRYQGLNVSQTLGTQGLFKDTVKHLRDYKLAAYNPDQDKDLQRLIDRLLERNSTRRFADVAMDGWKNAPNGARSEEERKLLTRLDEQLGRYREKVASAMQNIPASGVALTTTDLWEIVQTWRSYISSSGTPGFDAHDKGEFKPADPPVP